MVVFSNGILPGVRGPGIRALFRLEFRAGPGPRGWQELLPDIQNLFSHMGLRAFGGLVTLRGGGQGM